MSERNKINLHDRDAGAHVAPWETTRLWYQNQQDRGCPLELWIPQVIPRNCTPSKVGLAAVGCHMTGHPEWMSGSHRLALIHRLRHPGAPVPSEPRSKSAGRGWGLGQSPPPKLIDLTSKAGRQYPPHISRSTPAQFLWKSFWTLVDCKSFEDIDRNSHRDFLVPNLTYENMHLSHPIMCNDTYIHASNMYIYIYTGDISILHILCMCICQSLIDSQSLTISPGMKVILYNPPIDDTQLVSWMTGMKSTCSESRRTLMACSFEQCAERQANRMRWAKSPLLGLFFGLMHDPDASENSSDLTTKLVVEQSTPRACLQDNLFRAKFVSALNPNFCTI